MFNGSFPFYSGPYSVGLMDIEVPARHPRAFSDIKRNHEHLLRLKTVLITIYYPSGSKLDHVRSMEGKGDRSRTNWLPRPRNQLAKGYGRYSGLPQWVSVPFFAATSMFTKVPASRNTKLAENWIADNTSGNYERGYAMNNEQRTTGCGESKKPLLPLLIFSHGLGGTRTTYSSLCGEFASYGFICVAIEHRDGSGPRTFVNLPGEDAKKGDIFDEQNHCKRTIDKYKKKKMFGRKYDMIDYVIPKGNAKDTSPNNPSGIDAKLRSAQIDLRLAEIEEAYEVLRMIHAGRGEEVAKANLRKEGNVGSSSCGLDGVNWEAWKFRVHLEKVTMVGHSFGAATVVEVLRHASRFKFVSQGILYDPWGAAIQVPECENRHRIECPILCINSEAFMYWPKNFELVRELCHEVRKSSTLAWLLTIRGSIHISQSDFTLLYPKLSSFLLKMTANPRRAIDLNINASLEFLKLVMPDYTPVMNHITDQRLLGVSILEELPKERKPKKKWTGLRLRVPHEAVLRLRLRWARKRGNLKRAELMDKNAWLPRTPTGTLLEGLEYFEAGEEIWMHIAPTSEELKAHGLTLGNEAPATETLRSNDRSIEK